MWDRIGPDPAGHAAAAATTGAARLHRWVLDPATGAVSETALADRPVEFPTVDDERVGRDARYRYAVTDVRGSAGIVKFDAVTGTMSEHLVGADTVAGEAVFVPSAAPDRAEDDGWLLTITTRRDGGASQLLVLDATDVGGRRSPPSPCRAASRRASTARGSRTVSWTRVSTTMSGVCGDGRGATTTPTPGSATATGSARRCGAWCCSSRRWCGCRWCTCCP